MNVLLLHLSDVHIKASDDSVLSRGSLVAAATFPHLPAVDALVIVLSGDIAWSGTAEQYRIASEFLNSIKNTISGEADLPIHIVVAPGNHDCNFAATSQAVRTTLLNSLVGKDPDILEPDIVGHCVQVQNAFFAFRDRECTSGERTHNDPLLTTTVFNVGGKRIVFDVLNVAWMSQLHEEPGRLLFPVKRFAPCLTEKQDLRIVVMHHPLNWYHQSTYRPFRQFVRTLGQIVLTGHEHQQNVGENLDTETSHSVYLEGGVLQNWEAGAASTFNLTLLNLTDNQYCAELCEWNGSRYAPRELTGTWSTYRGLPTKADNAFRLQADFERLISDPGANFSHPGKDVISLSDVFVFPELQRLNADEPIAGEVSAEVLLDPSHIAGGVLVRGDEKAGRTVLLHELFRRYFDAGFVPILLRGSELRGTDAEQQKVISAAVERQYGKEAILAFKQATKSKKILLLDDIEKHKFPRRYLGKALEALLKRFAGIVATTSELFDVAEAVTVSGFEPLRKFVHYGILEFGHKLRYDLVCKWTAIGDDAGGRADDTMMLVDRAEKILTAVIGKNLVPSHPIYLLTLLQSLEMGKQGDLQNSAFGHYYYYLIAHSLGKLAIRPEELDEFFHYCSQLAWFVKSRDVREIGENELREFHRAYGDEFTQVPFERRYAVLLDARILLRRGEFVSFRYPYTYYYFLGKYFADNLSEPHIRALVADYATKLHLRENGNTILFLAHHSKDPFVYETVVHVLDGLFAGVSPMQFDGDTALLNDLVEDTPKLVFKDRDAMQSRRDERERQDRADRKLGEAASGDEGQDEPLNLVARLNQLMKTVEILGQILKNHYGPLRNTVKLELLEKSFDGALRGLRDIFQSLVNNKDALVADIEAALEKVDSRLTQERRNRLARRVVFDVLGMITHHFVGRTASSVGSEFLRGTVKDLVRKKDKISYRFIGLALELDFQDALPMEDIKKLRRDVQTNVFSLQLLRSLALRHLYMFKTSAKEKQMLCAELEIEMAQSRAIDARTKNVKLLK